jgi:hypothetical protein
MDRIVSVKTLISSRYFYGSATKNAPYSDLAALHRKTMNMEDAHRYI